MSELRKEFALGSQARCTITGFKGTIIGKTQWLTAPETIGVRGLAGENGKYPDAVWFNRGELEVVPALPGIESGKSTKNVKNTEPETDETEEDTSTFGDEPELEAPDEVEAPKITLAEVQKACLEFVKKNPDKNKEKVFKILAKFGVKKASDLKTEDYPAVLAALGVKA